MSEQSKLNDWHQSSVKQGLVNLHFSGGEISPTTTAENFCAEANIVNDLIASKQYVSRPDVF